MSVSESNRIEENAIQSKQLRDSKKNNNKSKENQEITRPVIICESLKEAEDKVLEMLKKGMTYPEITQVPFKIGDRIKRFNPKQISDVNKASNDSVFSSSNSDMSLYKENEVSTVFRMLKKGKSLTDIVILTGIKPEIVQGAYEQYIEFENLVLCPKPIFEKMKNLVLDDWKRTSPEDYHPRLKIGFEEISEYLQFFCDHFES